MFGDTSSPADAASVINSLIPSTHTATVSGNVLTVTSVANSPDDFTITFTAGVNQTGGTSSNDLRATRAVTQTGRDMAAVFGADAMVQVFSGTTSLGTVNGAGMTTAQIADAIRLIFQNSAAWNASGVTGSTFTVTSNHVGTTPAARLLVISGSTPDNEGNLTPGTLDVAQVVVNDGETTTVTGCLLYTSPSPRD